MTQQMLKRLMMNLQWEDYDIFLASAAILGSGVQKSPFTPRFPSAFSLWISSKHQKQRYVLEEADAKFWYCGIYRVKVLSQTVSCPTEKGERILTFFFSSSLEVPIEEA